MQDPADRGQLVREAAVCELAPRVEHLAGALDRVAEDAAVDNADVGGGARSRQGRVSPQLIAHPHVASCEPRRLLVATG
jgi:hypothetical protein